MTPVDITPVNQTLDTQHVLNTYVECGGVMPLILEKLNKQHNMSCPKGMDCIEHDIVTEAKLTNLIASQLSKLQDLVRAKTIMDTYYVTQLAISALISKMTFLDPFEASKTASNLIQKLSELTDRRTNENNINLNQYVFENMTPQQQQAWVYIQQHKDLTPVREAQSMPRQAVIEHTA